MLWLSESSRSPSRDCESLMVEPSLAYIHVEPRGLPAHVSRPPVAVIRTRSMTQQNKQSATIVWLQCRSFGEQDHHLHLWTDLSMCRYTLIEPDCNALCRITGQRDTLITQRCSRHIPLGHTGLLIWPRAYPSLGRRCVPLSVATNDRLPFRRAKGPSAGGFRDRPVQYRCRLITQDEDLRVQD